jgi:hypothetical protein
MIVWRDRKQDLEGKKILEVFVDKVTVTVHESFI